MSLSKKALLISAVALLPAFTWAQQQKDSLPRKATMKQCVEYALKNNISVKQAAEDVSLAKVDKTDALSCHPLAHRPATTTTTVSASTRTRTSVPLPSSKT